MTLELYHAEPVANSMKALICLKEKGIEFVSHYVDLHRFEQHEPWFVAINPNGQVPVLVHDGHAITESTVIMEYLEDVFPALPLRPADALSRARMRILNKFIDETVMPSVSMHAWRRMIPRLVAHLGKEEFERLLARIPLKEQQDKWRAAAADAFPEQELAEATRRVGVAAERFEQILSGSPWLAGSSFSLADVNAYAHASMAPRLFPELMNAKATPRWLDWIDRVRARPGVIAAHAMPDRTDPRVRVAR